MSQQQDPHTCYIRGMEICEVLDGIEEDLALIKLPEEKRKEKTFIRLEHIKESVKNGLESATLRLTKEQCLRKEVRDGTHKELEQMVLSAVQGDFQGMEERLFDLRERLGLSRFPRV